MYLASTSRDPAPDSRSVSIPVTPTPFFTGRVAELNAILNTLGDLRGDVPRETAVWGIPGVGKSQLALQYLLRHDDNAGADALYDHVLYLRASDQATIRNEFRRMAMGLGLVKPSFLDNENNDLFIEAVMGWFQKTERWLLVLDNVSDINHLLKFRPSRGLGHIVFTTRSKAIAELLCWRSNTIEVLPMPSDEGVVLVKSLMGPSFTRSSDAEATAAQVSAFAHGLPLTIEQVTTYAKFDHLPLAQALENTKRKEVLLQQHRGNTFHEDNPSTRAILITTFEAVARKFPMAGALFQILAYVEPSSISISMLLDGASEMQLYISRMQTYDRGAIRTAAGQQEYDRRTNTKPFDLLDYDPFGRELYQRVFRRGRRPQLPRVDSPSDIEMQSFWQSNGKFRGVFDDKTQMQTTLNQLEDSGLVKRVDNDTLRIHDLFAELMTVHTASIESSGVTAHVAATLVWLAFPVPQRYNARDRCYELLPHAVKCLQHLREYGNGDLLTDATIGAELNHVVASTFCLRRGFVDAGKMVGVDEDLRLEDYESGLKYYRDAFRGYMAAQKRLMAHSQMQKLGKRAMNHVRNVVLAEAEVEEACQLIGKPPMLFSPLRWTQEFERFGGNAVWRCIQTCARIGGVLVDLEEMDEAVWWLRKVKVFVESLWGPRIEVAEVRRIGSWLLEILMQKEDWEGALVLAEETLSRHVALCGYKGAEGLNDPVSFLGVMDTGLVGKLGKCLVHLNRGQEGMKWLKIALEEHRIVYGRYGRQCWGRVMALAWGAKEMEDWKAALEWWLEAVQLLLEDTKCMQYMIDEIVAGMDEAKRNCEQCEVLVGDLVERTREAEKAVETVGMNVAVRAKLEALKKSANFDDPYGDEADMELMRECLRMAEERGITGWR